MVVLPGEVATTDLHREVHVLRGVAGGLAGYVGLLPYLGGSAIYAWTIFLVFRVWGGGWGLLSIFFPGIATVVTYGAGISRFGFSEFVFGTAYGLAVLAYVALVPVFWSIFALVAIWWGDRLSTVNGPADPSEEVEAEDHLTEDDDRYRRLPLGLPSDVVARRPEEMGLYELRRWLKETEKGEADRSEEVEAEDHLTEDDVVL